MQVVQNWGGKLQRGQRRVEIESQSNVFCARDVGSEAGVREGECRGAAGFGFARFCGGREDGGAGWKRDEATGVTVIIRDYADGFRNIVSVAICVPSP